ncbi:MAG TPA: primosomal protein N', partial [Vicinamibacteria bacterium]|nr:primosomal protein N' [Vicinamibacteria bacterium]
GRKSVSGALATLQRMGYVAGHRDIHGRVGATRQIAKITEAGRAALAEEKLHPSSARVLTLLSVATEAVPVGVIRYEVGLKSGGLFRRLARKGLIELTREPVRQSPWERLRMARPQDSRPMELTRHQSEAIAVIVGAARLGMFSPMVLRGVTGSGKTEVYLRAAEEVVRAGRAVLLLVPEIALTPRLAALLYGRFGERVAILHSALGSAERRDEWWRIRNGQAGIVVGARSAVLAPIEDLGLVVVDEEHEGSYKQEEIPRYNARDVAIVRASEDRAVVVLGSATPSLESYTHAVEGRYRLVVLPERIGNRSLASVELVDMKEVVREEGPETIVSRPLATAIESRLAEGEQAMVLLNRRGYAGQLICRRCGMALTCKECSLAMTLHRRATLAVCHLCGLGRALPERCEMCQGEYLRHVGYGTERVEELMKERFPDSRVARMDRDTMRRKGSHEALLTRFAARELDILVGTQMLAKGHDFPAVTLVGVLAADNALGAPDFRAAERTFQLLTQVAGRAGRGDRPGKVLIQTFTPDHYSLEFARSQDFEGFYESERKFRSALLYPPAVRLVNLVFEGANMAEATREARRAATFLKSQELESLRVLGPAFAVRSKVRNRYRCQLLLKLTRSSHGRVRALIRTLLKDESIARSMTIDVDPLTLA